MSSESTDFGLRNEMKTILKKSGIKSYDDSIPDMMIEFFNSFVTKVAENVRTQQYIHKSDIQKVNGNEIQSACQKASSDKNIYRPNAKYKYKGDLVTPNPEWATPPEEFALTNVNYQTQNGN